MARRVTADEERDLRAAARKLERAKEHVEVALAERDRLIADLLGSNARIADVSEILGLSRQAVREARDRAQPAEPS